MDIAALVIGIISIILAFIPLCGVIALLPAIVGLILATIDTVAKNKAKEPLGMSIAGIVLNGMAIVIIVFWFFIAAAAS